MTKRDDWDRLLQPTPSPAKVASLARTHGIETCRARWPWLTQRTLYNIIARHERARAA